MTESVYSRFERYAEIDTQSSEDSGSFPSTAGQATLAKLLVFELESMGIEDAVYDTASGCVYAHIPANDGGEATKTLGFLAHLDTSPETSGRGVRPRLIYNYDGGDVVLSEENELVLSPETYPEMRDYIGKTLIVTDGSTLLGADDKAGIAEIMTMAAELMSEDTPKHGRIAIAFTPDEEIGGGISRFDLERFGADYAYTVDGGALGELEYECFNAASVKVSVKGVSIHTGEAKGKMKNASRIAMEFDSLLPPDDRPELTDGYQGFFHLESIEGGVEHCVMEYLIRDHDKEEFWAKKQLMFTNARLLCERYGEGAVTVTVKDTYYNMYDKIYPDNMFLIENAEECMQKLGIEPKIKPIRGGTDGANLSYRGLPCPNLCAGGHNFHGRFEYCCVESMEQIVRLLKALAESRMNK